MNRLFRNIIIFLFFAFNLNAQSLFYEKYTNENGLPQNSIYSIIQDHNGFIWIATEGGLARFDGTNMKVIAQSDGLPAQHVNSVFEDSKGNIWVATISGVAKLMKDSIQVFTSANGLPDEYCYVVQEDKNGGIWLGTTNKGAVLYTNGEFKIFDSENGFCNKKVQDIKLDSNGNLWFATEGEGVWLRNEEGFKQFTKKDGLSSDSVYSIKENYKGEMLFGTNHGMTLYNGKFKRFGKRYGIKDFTIKDIVEDKYRDIWLCYDGGGIAQFDGAGVTNYNEDSGFPSNTVTTGLEDYRGDLWFGTQNGLIRIKAERVQTVTKKLNGLSGDVVYAINQKADGSYLFAAYNGGINVLKNGRIKTYTEEDGLISNNFSSILIASDGKIWLGADKGVTVWEGNKFKSYTPDDGLVGYTIMSIIEDRNGNIWLGGENGVSVYDGKKFKNYTIQDGIGRWWVYCLYEDSEGNIWMGTDVDGLTKFDGKKFVIYGQDQGLPKGAVLDITEDRFGNYWIGMEGGGLVKYDGVTFKQYGQKNGLSNETCYTITEIGQYLFVATGNGIDRIDYTQWDDLGSEAVRVFTTIDGLPNNETTMGSAFLDVKQNYWVGTQEGVVMFNPRNKPNNFAPPIFLTQILNSGKALNLDSLSENLLELEYDQNSMNFYFNGISFDSPDKMIFAYRLLGLQDTTWQETQERHINYPFLPAGEYTFMVKARNGDNIWSEKIAEFKFIINPPFYSTWWFYTIVGISIILIAYIFYALKTEQVKKRNIELANMVRMRTKELEEEKNKSDELLMNILPESAVNELKENGVVEPREFKNVSILFTDFKGFTWTASVLPADKLVNELNDIFASFDKIMIKYGLEKLKTIGDAYMAACGLPIPREDHAIRVIEAAFAMQDYIKQRNEDSAIKWEMRLGIHSGQVIAGVVGVKKFTYDIWGDTVNIAARMESSGAPGRINISAFTYMLIRDYYECEYRGKVEAKGKGKVDMYFVVDRKPKVHKIIENILEESAA